MGTPGTTCIHGASRVPTYLAKLGTRGTFGLHHCSCPRSSPPCPRGVRTTKPLCRTVSPMSPLVPTTKWRYELVEISPTEKRRRLKAFWTEYRRVSALCHKMAHDDELAERRAEYFIEHGVWLPLALPALPEFPPECNDMVCGARGRRKGTPCQCKEIEHNGRCKWHGGRSTGPKTPEGKIKSLANLKRGPKL